MRFKVFVCIMVSVCVPLVAQESVFDHLADAVKRNSIADFRKIVAENRSFDINTKQNGFAIIHVAAGNADPSFIGEIFARKGDLNLKSDSNSTALHIACNDGNRRVVEYLLSRGVATDVPDNSGRIPLHYAVKRNDFILAKMLIVNGSDLKLPDNEGNTPLHYGFWAKGYFGSDNTLIVYLVKNGANPDVKNRAGKSPVEMEQVGKKAREIIIRAIE